MNRNLVIAAAGGVALVFGVSYLAVSARQESARTSGEDANNEAAAPQVDLKNGEAVYDYWCAACHDPGPGHPGTQSLEVKYGGEIPAALEDRTDLAPETTAYFVRNGYALMPFFRKTEIGDDDLRDLAAYLARKE